MTVLRVFTAALAIAVLATSASMAGAQSWPTRPVTVVVPFTAGNASDLIGRITLEQVAKQVGQPFGEPPRRGRHGRRQSGRQGRSRRPHDPDAFVIVQRRARPAQELALRHAAGFRAGDSIGIQPVVLIVSPSKGFKTVGDLVAAAKANPGAMNFASAGIARPRTWARSGSATRRASRRSTFRSAARRRRSPRS